MAIPGFSGKSINDKIHLMVGIKWTLSSKNAPKWWINHARRDICSWYESIFPKNGKRVFPSRSRSPTGVPQKNFHNSRKTRGSRPKSFNVKKKIKLKFGFLWLFWLSRKNILFLWKLDLDRKCCWKQAWNFFNTFRLQKHINTIIY